MEMCLLDDGLVSIIFRMLLDLMWAHCCHYAIIENVSNFCFVLQPLEGTPQIIPDVNVYQHKKTLGEFALLIQRIAKREKFRVIIKPQDGFLYVFQLPPLNLYSPRFKPLICKCKGIILSDTRSKYFARLMMAYTILQFILKSVLVIRKKYSSAY